MRLRIQSSSLLKLLAIEPWRIPQSLASSMDRPSCRKIPYDFRLLRARASLHETDSKSNDSYQAQSQAQV
jgi:hypothetical protein